MVFQRILRQPKTSKPDPGSILFELLCLTVPLTLGTLSELINKSTNINSYGRNINEKPA